MKKLSQIILSTSLILFFSGCANTNLRLPAVEELPSFSLPEFTFFDDLVVDKRLPRVNGLKIYTDMDEATIEWKPIYNSNIAGYRIFRKVAKATRFQLIKIMDDKYSSHFTDLRLSPNTLYTYAVSTYTKDERVSDLSNSIQRKTSPLLKEVEFFKALSGFPNRIKLLWKPHKNEAVKNYEIQRQDVKTKIWKKIATVEGRLSIEYIDKDVESMTYYVYQISAQTYEGISSRLRKTQKASARTLPATITGLQATNNLPRKIELIWNKSQHSELLYYNVYKSSFADSLFKIVGQTKANHFVDLLDEDKKEVYYKVTAVDKYNLESFMQKTSKAGITQKNLQSPIDAKATIEHKMVIVSWKNIDPRTHKNKVIKNYRDGLSIESETYFPPKNQIFIDKNVKENTNYSYTIIAIDKDGVESQPTQEIRVSINKL